VSGDEAAGVVSDRVLQAFERLRREYLEEMPARLEALEAAARAGDHAALRTGLHQLAGSGGSHGFPGISAAARELERVLPSASEHDPAARLSALHDAVATARKQLPEQ
jgi:HPt (histidine-containing phosphotransfer) domain-containing protein